MHIVIAGVGRVGSERAQRTSLDRHDVVAIDKRIEALDRVGPQSNGETVIGEAFDVSILRQAGIERAEVFVAVTSSDTANLMATEVVRRVFKARVQPLASTTPPVNRATRRSPSIHHRNATDRERDLRTGRRPGLPVPRHLPRRRCRDHRFHADLRSEPDGVERTRDPEQEGKQHRHRSPDPPIRLVVGLGRAGPVRTTRSDRGLDRHVPARSSPEDQGETFIDGSGIRLVEAARPIANPPVSVGRAVVGGLLAVAGLSVYWFGRRPRCRRT